MIKNYNPNFRGVHTVRVTFMCWNYVGHIAYKVGGNCRGADLLEADFLEFHTDIEISKYVENDCKFSFDEDAEIYTASLKDSDGGILDVEGDEYEFRRMIVGIEFSELLKEQVEKI